MLALIDRMVLEVIIALKLGVASSHRVCSFQQVVTEESVAGLEGAGVLGFKAARLMLHPHKSCILGNRGMGLKTVDVADLSDDTGRIDLADAGTEVRVLGIISN